MHVVPPLTWPSLVGAALLATAAHGQSLPATGDPATTTQVHLLAPPPLCELGSSSTLNLMTGIIWEQRGKGKVNLATGGAVWQQGRRWLFVEGGVADDRSIRALIEASARGPVPAEVVVEDLPVLESMEELTFQYPVAGKPDWLAVAAAGAAEEQYPVVHGRPRGRVLRYQGPAGPVLALELDEAQGTPLLTGREDYHNAFAALTTVEQAGDTSTLYSFGKGYGGMAALKRALDDQRQALPAGQTLLVQAGGFLGEREEPGVRELCRGLMAELKPDIYVPRGEDLSLGVEGLSQVAKELGLTLVAANLQRAGGDKDASLFPPFVLRQVGPLQVALVGAVGPSELAKVPSSVRGQWLVDRPTPSVLRAIADARQRLQRKPDLVVVVVAGNAREVAEIYTGRVTGNPDMVIGDFERHGYGRWQETLRIDQIRSREGLGRHGVGLNARNSRLGPGHVTASFAPPAPPHGRWRLLQLLHEGGALPPDAPLDPAVEHLEHVSYDAVDSAQVLLPDVAPLVQGKPELEALVYGERVLMNHGYRHLDHALPPRFTDPLWMRLVTNLAREATGADVAVMRNIFRWSDIGGPVLRVVITGWLPDIEEVELLELEGKDLAALMRLLATRAEDVRLAPEDHVFFSGMDLAAGLVGGRPVEPELRYRVVIGDSLRTLPEVEELLARARSSQQRFEPRAERYAAAAQGQPLKVRQLVLGALERNLDPRTHSFDPARLPAVERWLSAQGAARTPQWTLRIKELSLQGSAYRNSDNVAQFAGSRETRTATPDLYNLGAAADARLGYDGPSLAWDLGLTLAYSGLFLDIQGVDVPPQEQQDDAVLFTELRLNQVELSVGSQAYRVLPFARLAYDTELTPTALPQDPSRAFDRQALLQQSAGLVANLGSYLKELRLGLLVQQDLSAVPGSGWDTGAVRYDVGVISGYRLELPLGPLQLQSQADLRYLAPDGDDLASDLALRLHAVNKLALPVAEALSLFVFADLFAVSGKLEANRELGGSLIAGGGVQLSQLWRL